MARRLISLSFFISASFVGNSLAAPVEATPASPLPVSTPTTTAEVLLPTRVWMGDRCAEQCREMWGWRGHVFGSNPWGDVVFSGEPKWLEFTRPESNSTTPTTSAITTPSITSTLATTQTSISSEVITSLTPTVTSSRSLSIARNSQTLTKTRSAQLLPTLEVVKPTRTKVVPTSTSTTTRSSTRRTSTRTTSIRTRRPEPTPDPPREEEEEEEEPRGRGQGNGLGVQDFGNGDIGQYLRHHNEARQRHGANPVTWSFDLQSKAQQWADNCQFEHSGGIFGRVGENLAAGTGAGFSIQAMIKAWVDEVVDYDPSNPQGSHFTQVVWKDTTEIGCAVQTCNNIFPGSAARYYVCEYLPAGNVGGQFDQNVQK